MPVVTCDNLAIIAGKLSAQAIRVMGAGLGSNLPGKVARKLSPGLLSRLSKLSRKGVLAVSGTNGKSTTCGLINSILRCAGFKVVHNRQGANLVTGITATVLNAASWKGSLDADFCLFEIDEASLPVVASEVAISSVVVTNLFRDQLDRFGELDTTAALINKGIAANCSQAVLNADDPNVSQLAADSARLYYGIQSFRADSGWAGPVGAREFADCFRCGQEFQYDLVFYGQLGHYTCRHCGQSRPLPQVVAENVQVHADSSQFTLKFAEQTVHVTLPLPGLFNVYNALAAAALAVQLHIPLLKIKEGLLRYTTLFGRSERLAIDGKSVMIQLIKNPAGASQAVSSVTRDDTAAILIAINDNFADGRDISWLWDVDFELLASHGKPIVVSGQRADDMAVRLKYAGLPAEQIRVESSLSAALQGCLAELKKDETLWVLPTYTCLLDLTKILKARGLALAGT